MSEEQIRSVQRQLTEEMKELDVDGETVSIPEVITAKESSFLPVVSLIKSRTEKFSKGDVSKLKKAKSILKKIGTSIEKENAILNELGKVKEKYFTSDEAQNIQKQVPTQIFQLLSKGDLNRAELSKLAELLARWDQDQKMRLALDLEIESHRKTKEKLNRDLSDAGVKSEDKVVVSVRRPIFTKIKEKIKLAKMVRDYKKNRDGAIAANKHDDMLHDKELQAAFLKGEDLSSATESISNKTIEEIQNDLANAQQRFLEINAIAEEYNTQNGHYLQEHLEEKQIAWTQYYNEFLTYIVKRQELERENHYSELKGLFSKYPVTTKEDGTFVFTIGDETFEVSKNNFMNDMEQVLAADKKMNPTIDDNIENDKPDDSIKVGEPEESIKPEETEEISSVEETLTPKAIEPPKKVTKIVKEKDSYTEQIESIEDENAKIRQRLEEIKDNNNRFREEQQKQAAFYGANWSEMEIDPEHTFRIQDENGNVQELRYIVDERDELNERLKSNNRMIQSLETYRNAEKSQTKKEEREKRLEEINRQGLLDEAHKFFRHLDTSTTKGYDVSGLSDDEVIDLYNELRENPMNNIYMKTKETMENDYREATPVSSEKSESSEIEEPTNNETQTEIDDQNNIENNIDEEASSVLQQEVEEQINDSSSTPNNATAEEKANEVVIEMFTDQYKEAGLNEKDATIAAVNYFKEQYPEQNVPTSYAKYVDTSGVDVIVYDQDPNSFEVSGFPGLTSEDISNMSSEEVEDYVAAATTASQGIRRR